MGKKGIKITCPSAVDNAEGLRKLEHYYGIEFIRGASNGGGDNGYHKMIGDPSLLREMRFHNQMKIAAIKDAELVSVLNQTNWRQLENGGASVLDGTDGCDIMQVHTKDVYAILGGSNPTYERFIVSDEPFVYDGDEAVYYPAYGETPDYETVLNNVARSIRNDSVAGTHEAGIITGCTDQNFGQADAGGFPRTSTSRYLYEQYARGKNPESDSNLPYMNICNQDLELTTAFMFIEFKTKQLNNLLGHGISANVAPTEATWGKVSGFKLTADGEATRYHTFGTTMWVGDGATTSNNMWTILNGSCPVLKIFEAQLTASDGATLEALNDADGNPVQGKADGVMTGIWTKSFSFNVEAALTQGGEKKNWKVECVVRVPVWRGRTRLWGHLNQWYSGYECVRYRGSDEMIHHVLYRSPSVEALVADNDEAVKSGLGQFALEKVYENLGEDIPTNVAWSGFWGKSMAKAKNGSISTCEANETIAGASMYNYESAMFYRDGTASTPEGQYIRRGVLVGDFANGGFAVLRIAAAAYAPSFATPNLGSGFRVTLN